MRTFGSRGKRVDLSEESVGEANENLKRHGIKGQAFARDARHNGFADGYFDKVKEELKPKREYEKDLRV